MFRKGFLKIFFCRYLYFWCLLPELVSDLKIFKGEQGTAELRANTVLKQTNDDVSRDRSFIPLLLLVNHNGWVHLAWLNKCPACK